MRLKSRFNLFYDLPPSEDAISIGNDISGNLEVIVRAKCVDGEYIIARCYLKVAGRYFIDMSDNKFYGQELEKRSQELNKRLTELFIKMFYFKKGIEVGNSCKNDKKLIERRAKKAGIDVKSLMKHKAIQLLCEEFGAEPYNTVFF